MPDAALARPKRDSLLICLGLALATAIAYGRVGGFEFTSYDDPDFVTNNPYTQAGLTARTIAWTCHSEVARNWHPVTMLTHALDCQLFGLRPGPPHIVNLLWHIANTLLLFAVLRRMTGALWRSAAVAGFFALHPLHVESVAWIAERKDVLGAFFWLLSMWAYLRYTEKLKLKTGGASAWYFLTLVFFALGLMSKPMLVTLPFVLALLDFWPLQRWKTQRTRVVVEKLPFLALSAIDSVITWSIQQHGGAMLAVNSLSSSARVDNALVSYVRYLGRMFWPENLAGLYLRHGDWPAWQVAFASLFLVAVTAIVLSQSAKRPYLAFGWFWYLGTLVPVIGLVQVGMQSMADRYTYLPLIGIFIMIVWGAAELRTNPKMLAAATVALLGLCLCLTARQTLYWKDSETLFQRMIAVTDRNYMAHYNLGNLYTRQKRTDQAIEQYQAALHDEPNYADAANNLGGIYLDLKRYDEAIAQYANAARILSDFTHYFNLANALADAASARHDSALFAQAVQTYRLALALNPNSAEAHHNFGLTWAAQGDPSDALTEFEQAARLQPDFEAAQFDLAEALSRANRIDEAQTHYAAAARLNPTRAETHNGLGLCDAMRGDMTNAAAELKEAVRLQPAYAYAWGNLGNALAAQNKFDNAIVAYASALKLNPSDFQTEFNFGLTLYRQGKNVEAKDHLRAALRIKPDYEAARQALQQIP
jgi:tetratricopeptide (TPR) repeat protein